MLSSTFIDELGYLALDQQSSNLFYQVISTRHSQKSSTVITTNTPFSDWGKLLGDLAAVTAMLDRILHHGHVLKCGPRSWRTKMAAAASDTQ